MINWKLEKRKLKDLKEHPKNPRTLSAEQGVHIQQSIDKFGIVDKIIINQDNMIIGGHQRKKILKKMGIKEVDCFVPDRILSSDEVDELNIRLNKNTGDWDWDVLANEWDVDNLLEWGFTPEELMGAPVETVEPTEDDSEILEPSKDEDAITKLGDVYELNQHRIVCGDSTLPEYVNLCFHNKSIEITFTSPPYNLGKSIKLSNNKSKNRDDSPYDKFEDNDENEWLSLVSNSLLQSKKNTSYQLINLQILAGNKIKFIEWLYRFRNNFVDIFVWQKHAAPVIAKHVMNSQIELVLIFCSEEKPSRSIKTSTFERGQLANFYAGESAGSFSHMNEYKDSHAATMPLPFAKYMVKNFCSESVYDPFLGSGTTLIAAEMNNRICYGIEISPAYCDIIVNRWKKFIEKNNKPYTIKRNGILV